MKALTLDEHLGSYLQTTTTKDTDAELDTQLIRSLKDTIASLLNSSPTRTASRTAQSDDPNDIWQQFRQQSLASHQDSVYELSRSQPSSSSAPHPLDLHLAQLQAKDVQLAHSVRQSVLSALSSSRSSDEVSAELAETLGFEHLELVSSIVSDPQSALRAIQNASNTETSDEGPPTTNGTISLPAQSTHQNGHEAPYRGSRSYLPSSQIVFQTQEERQLAKRFRHDQRKAHRPTQTQVDDHRLYTPEELERLREQSLRDADNRPLFTGTSNGANDIQYPHVFSSGAQGNILSAFGQKFALPLGTLREERDFYEEVTIPPPKNVPMRNNERLIPISEMDTICRGAFPGYKSLNRLQSVVYPLAYKTNENLLICAPTGAGKTDVAMLTVMRTLSQYANNLEPTAGEGAAGFHIAKNDFKIIYVAPMKALAAEIVRKFSKRLQYLGIKVRELTGDMQMTRQEIAETQMIVTTPEKWDVVTRKPTGEGELATKVRLLIIDEVHLLHDQRGSVIETIVARTLRLVESSQSLIRIVGLSATLPNYVDVADFLRVNRYQGLFYFDSSFRPVPLQQHFIGVKGKTGSMQSRANLDKACFEKVSSLVEAGHQVMIFVHARKETVKTALTMREMFRDEAMSDVIQSATDENPRKAFYQKELQSSRNRELKELFEYGFGIHHAGMLRSDRTLSERMFEAGVTRVLCCTATLAWGVNLPAYAVVIKGTDVYDSSAGKFIDLSILDVLQIFGRAGRPQYEDLGVGYILTSQDRLSHYVDAITSQHPIESKFIGGLIDSLNAEISLGTVGSVNDGVSWLGYTYLFTRMKRTPLTYGMKYDEVAEDPHLGAKRQQLIDAGVKKLVEAKMVDYDAASGHLQVTDLGRVAAKYYVGYRTIEIFNERMRPNMTEADVLGILSHATDFEQITPRDTEEKELKKLMEEAPCEVAGGIETSPGKVSILLQAYISKTFIEDFALVSDSAYVAQNAGRIIRSLLEISLSRRWARTASALISMSKAIEKRMWPFDHPLQQSHLTPDTMYAITRWADDVDIADLAEMSSEEIGKLVHLNTKLGSAVQSAAKSFPRLSTQASLRPLSHDLLRIDVRIDRVFEWSERHLGRVHGFYIWIEDENEIDISQWLVHLTRVTDSVTSNATFTVSMRDTMPSGLTLRWMSDSWLGSEGSSWLAFDDLVMPAKPPSHDNLFDLPLLPIYSSITDEIVRETYSHRFSAFNAIQTQCFHSLRHTSANTLLCGPNASGKTTVAMMAAWRTLNVATERAVVVLYPKRDVLAAESRSCFAMAARTKGIIVHRTSLSKDVDPFVRLQKGPRVLLTTASSLLHALAANKDLVQSISLLVAEDLQMLDPQYELALTKFMMHSSEIDESQRPRIVATSSSLNDASSLAKWIGANELSTYNFHPKDRPSTLSTTFQSFDLPHSASLLKTMVKPAFDKMKECKALGNTIVVVPSRGQCYTIAADLITRAAAEMDMDGYIGMPSEEIEAILPHVQDVSVHEALLHGIGIVHDLTAIQDRRLIESLYEQGMVKVLITPRECCWGMMLRAHLVVVMSTQYVRLTKMHGAATGVSDRELVDYALSELGRMQSLAVQPGTPSTPPPSGECLILCQTDKVKILEQMLQSGVPLHSTLLQEEDRASVLMPALLRDIVNGVCPTQQKVVDVLTWTMLPVELWRNPSYYDCASGDLNAVSTHIIVLAESLTQRLVELRLIETTSHDDGGSMLQGTHLGKALATQAGSTLLHVSRWHTNHSAKPARAAKAVDTFVSASPKQVREDKLDVENNVERDILNATLSILAPEWRSAFHLVSPSAPMPAAASGAAEDHASAKPDGHADTNEAAEGKNNAEPAERSSKLTPISLTRGEKRKILFCLYFTKLGLVTPSEAQLSTLSRRARKKHDQKLAEQNTDSNGAVGSEEHSNVAGTRTEAQTLAIQKLELELEAQALALLTAISSIGGRN